MIRYILAALVAINLAIFVWSITTESTGPLESELSEPGMGTIRLIDEAEMMLEPPRDAVMPETRPQAMDSVPEAVTFGYSGDALLAIGEEFAEPVEAIPEIPSSPDQEIVASETEHQMADSAPEDVTIGYSDDLLPSTRETSLELEITTPSEQHSDLADKVDLIQQEAVISVVAEVDHPVAIAPEEKTILVEVVRICGEITQVVDKGLADELITQLELAGIGSQLETATHSKRTGFWVLIQGLENSKVARAKVEELKAAGLMDIWLFRKGPHKNAISLGLFGSETNANQRAMQVRNLGFETQVLPKFKEQTQYLISYNGETNLAELDKILEPFSDRGVEWKQNACP